MSTASRTDLKGEISHQYTIILWQGKKCLLEFLVSLRQNSYAAGSTHAKPPAGCHYMTVESGTISLASTRVQYRFISVHRIAGLSAIRAGVEMASELPVDVGRQGVSATLTVNPNSALTEIDRGASLAYLMLMGFTGHTMPEDILRAVHQQAAQHAEERLKRFGPSSVYLVIEAHDAIDTNPTDIARDLGAALLAFDAVDKPALGTKYQELVQAALTSIALCVDTTPEVAPVAEGIALILPDGRPLYSVTITGGNANLTVARPATEQDAHAIQESLTGLLKDTRLSSPSQLLADALRSTGDRLEGFILAWAALEMTIRKYTVRYETGEWINNLSEANRALGAALHQDYVHGEHQYYSLAQKVRAFALCFGLGPGEDLAEQITRIRKQYREPLYHEGAIEAQLPVEAVVALTRRVMRAALRQ